jgi:hypothetical protein
MSNDSDEDVPQLVPAERPIARSVVKPSAAQMQPRGTTESRVAHVAAIPKRTFEKSVPVTLITGFLGAMNDFEL